MGRLTHDVSLVGTLRSNAFYRYSRSPNRQLIDASQPPQSSEPLGNGEEATSPEACSIIRLQNGMVLYLREINKSLS